MTDTAIDNLPELARDVLAMLYMEGANSRDSGCRVSPFAAEWAALAAADHGTAVDPAHEESLRRGLPDAVKALEAAGLCEALYYLSDLNNPLAWLTPAGEQGAGQVFILG